MLWRYKRPSAGAGKRLPLQTAGEAGSGKQPCGQQKGFLKKHCPFTGRRETDPFYGLRRVPEMRPFRACARRALRPAPVPQRCVKPRQKGRSASALCIWHRQTHRGPLFRTGHSPLLQPRAGTAAAIRRRAAQRAPCQVKGPAWRMAVTPAWASAEGSKPAPRRPAQCGTTRTP